MAPTPADVLAIERAWLGRRDLGAKAEDIAGRYGMTPTQWAMLVNEAIDDPQVIAADPVTARILRQRRDRGRRIRSATGA